MKKFMPLREEAEKRGKLRLVASPDGAEGSVTIHADARLYAGLFDGAETATLALDAHRPGRGCTESVDDLGAARGGDRGRLALLLGLLLGLGGLLGGGRGAGLRLPDLEADRLELAGELLLLLVVQVVLEHERLELGGLDEPALLRALDERLHLVGLEQFGQLVLRQGETSVLSVHRRGAKQQTFAP